MILSPTNSTTVVPIPTTVVPKGKTPVKDTADPTKTASVVPPPMTANSDDPLDILPLTVVVTPIKEVEPIPTTLGKLSVLKI